MEIKNLKLDNYRKVKDLNIELKPGINVILGKNEAGKSTISSAILDALFLNPNSKSKEAKETLPWNEAKAGNVAMQFSIKDQGYSLVKDFSAGSCVLKGEHEEITSQARINELLQSAIGISSKSLYHNTAFISQKDIAVIKTDMDLLNAVQNVAIEGENSVSIKKVINELKRKLLQINKGADKMTSSPGTIARIRSQISNLQQKIAVGEKEVRLTMEQGKGKKEIGKKLEGINKEIEILTNILEVNDSIRESRKQLGSINEQLDELESKVKKIEGFDHDINKLQENVAEFDINKAREDLEQLLKEESLPVTQPNHLPLYILIAAGIFGFAAGLIFKEWLLIVISAILALGSGIKLLLNIRKNQQDLKVTKKDDKQSILQAWQCSSEGELRDIIKEQEEKHAKINLIKAQRSGLLNDMELEELNKKIKLLYRDKHSLEFNVLNDENINLELEASEFLRKKHDLNKYLKEKEELVGKEIGLTTMLEHKGIEEEELARMKQEEEMLGTELTYWQQKAEVYRLTIEGMEHALTATASDFKDKAAAFLNANLKLITAGRYDTLNIGNELNIKVFSKDKNDWVEPVAELSSGTIDQIYFVIRLAFLHLISPHEKVPLILDDPFVSFDSERLQATRTLLEKLSHEQQILLFTHNVQYRDWGNLIELV